MVSSWDLFFSYRRHDLERAQPLLDALAQAGVRVWRDKTDIPDQAPITDEIRNGIANCKAFLAFYSRTYPASNPCQQELTIAWLAAQQMDESASRRVWILNPEASFEHMPALLRDQQSPLFKEHGAQLASAVSGIERGLASLDAIPLGSGMRGLPEYYGMEPIQARYFAGRAKEFWDLHGKLTANRISIITGVYGHASAQVRGLGGNGKSLLAREYSIRFGPAYPGGVFWLNAFGHDDAKGALDGEQREALRQDQIRVFAIRSGVPVNGLKPEEIETEFWRAVERRGQRCLWIVDDVPSGLSQAELERAWNARWAGAATLMTTRSKQYGAVGSALDLGVLSSEEAAGLLRSHRNPTNPGEESAVVRIVELLGCHPLAVEVAGSYLAQGFESFQSYVDALADPHEDAVEFGTPLEEYLPMGHERSIRATLLKSIEKLRSEGKDFLRLASILAVAPIPVDFIRATFEIEGAGRARSLQAVNQAETLSLCERFGGDARTVHTLVSRTMHFQFPADPRIVELRSAAIKVLSQRLQKPSHIGEHSAIAMDIPHARHVISNDLQSADEAVLASWIARRDYERGDYGSARKLEEQVLAARRRVLGEEHPGTLTAMSDLATTLHAQGDLGGARKLEEQALATFRCALGDEHPDTLSAMNNLAQMLKAQGDLGGARKLEEQVLAALRRVPGKEHPGTLTAMNNLAATLHAQGDLGGAWKLQEQALAALRRVLGEEHPDTLTAMNNLAGTLYAQGDLEGAGKLEEQALTAFRRMLGEEHPDTLNVMSNLAGTRYAQGDLGGARKLEEQALAALRRVLGDEHPDTLRVMNNLAGTLKAQDDLEGARKLQEQALTVSRRVLGDEHPDTLMAMNNFKEMGGYGEAQED